MATRYPTVCAWSSNLQAQRHPLPVARQRVGAVCYVSATNESQFPPTAHSVHLELFTLGGRCVRSRMLTLTGAERYSGVDLLEGYQPGCTVAHIRFIDGAGAAVGRIRILTVGSR